MLFRSEDFFDLGPMLLSNDLAAVKVRRRIRDMVEREKADAEQA